ncbi:MAG: S8 family serine peptidase [Candidatus Parabeggiatoa sp.]|nr:S8 family serine peptidase [Candidatus Parabeggiatoa sp.]
MMKHKNRHTAKQSVLKKWLFFGSVFALNSMFLPAISSAQGQDVVIPQNLLSKMQQSSSARVIIGLGLNTPVGASSGPSSVEDKKRAIAQAQNAFLEDLGKAVGGGAVGGSAAGSAAGGAPAANAVGRFATIPFLVMGNVDSGTLSKIRGISQVTSVELDTLVPPILAQSVPLIGANNAWDMGYSGQGQAVAVLDTGVDSAHPAFSGGKVVSEACYSSNYARRGATTVCPNGSEEQTGLGAGVACTGVDNCEHGTHVAGIVAGNGGGIQGVAKNANIIAVQVFSRIDTLASCDPRPVPDPRNVPCVLSYTSDQIRGLERVLALHRSGTTIASVNMSLGGGKYAASCDGDNLAIKAAIDNLRAVGIATLIASGNKGYTDAISSPACISSAISVGATDKSDKVASYSNSAAILDLLAPGSNIRSSIPGGGTAFISGTSMATPHVAGAWAILKGAEPTATVDQILNNLIQTGTPIRDLRNGITKPRMMVVAAPKACAKVVALKNTLPLGCGSSQTLKVVTLRNALNSNKCLEGNRLKDCGEIEAQKWIWDGKRLLNVHNRYWKYYPYGTTKWLPVDGTALMKKPPLCLDGATTNLPVKGCNGTDAQRWIWDWDDDVTLLRNFVIVYTGSDYTGTYSILGIGEYKIVYGHNGSFNQSGIPEDSLSSLRVPKGLKVTLYKDNGFQGRSITIYEDTPSLDSQDFANFTSSIKIERK